MFNTLGSFSVVYFALAAVLFILILFEKHFIQLEDRIRAKRNKSNKAAHYTTCKKIPAKGKNTTSVKNSSRSSSVRRVPNRAA